MKARRNYNFLVAAAVTVALILQLSPPKPHKLCKIVLPSSYTTNVIPVDVIRGKFGVM